MLVQLECRMFLDFNLPLLTKKVSLEKIGENVEPLEIEEAAMRSALIQQIVVIGQASWTPFFPRSYLWFLHVVSLFRYMYHFHFLT